MTYKGLCLIENNCIEFINHLLQKKFQNDYIFEKTFFEIQFELNTTNPQECINFIYRLFWESMYLRRTSNKSFIINNTVHIIISLSEALTYITQVTPPIFREKTIDTLKTVDDIRSMLEFYLADTKASDYQYRLDLFAKCMQMCEIETVWDYNNIRFKMIQDKLYNDTYKQRNYIIGVIDYAQESIHTLKALQNGDIIGSKIQLSICIYDIDIDYYGLLDLFEFLCETNVIINVKHMNNALYISLYDDIIYAKWANWFSRWYYKL